MNCHRTSRGTALGWIKNGETMKKGRSDCWWDRYWTVLTLALKVIKIFWLETQSQMT